MVREKSLMWKKSFDSKNKTEKKKQKWHLNGYRNAFIICNG